MSNPEHLSDALRELFDDYLDGRLNEARLRELEDRLRADAESRRSFIRYARLHTDLQLELRARQGVEQALARIEEGTSPHQSQPGSAAQPRPSFRRYGRLAALAATVLLAIGLGWFLLSQPSKDGATGHESAVAWLVNAQDCRWSDGDPAGGMQAGKTLHLDHGLAEIHFRCGAKVVLQGPAQLELLSDRSARLLQGQLTARVPEPAAGFEVLSPQGKVIDLGTEFGIAVSDSGAANVYVFEGKVEAHSSPNSQDRPVSLTRSQGAQIASGKVTLTPAGVAANQFVRAIVPPPVIRPRTLRLTFDRAVPASVLDARGAGTGLTHRLPGTGGRLPERDPNLQLDTSKAQLELTTTDSDLNNQNQLYHGEYLGVRLADLGFTGTEDFAATVTIPNIPALEFIGQFGLYAGARSDQNIRGGLISRRQTGEYTQFLVNNHHGRDYDLGRVGLLTTGNDLRLTLKRTAGKYSLTVENLTTGSSSTLTIRHPEFLDAEHDLFVGLFGANTHSNVRKTLVVKELEVTVWTVCTVP